MMDWNNPESVESKAWCTMMSTGLADGGVWGIPRSGLIFTKQADKLVLTDTMPHDPAMPITEAQLAEQQASDFDAVRRHFGAINVDVVRKEEA